MLTPLFSRLFAVWLALTLIFVALRILPGDAITAQLLEIGMTEQQIASRRAEFGLDQPVITQYMNYWENLLKGDFGTSLSRDVPVITLIANALPSTIMLVTYTLITAAAFGLVLGILAGWSWLAKSLIALALALPIYWTGTLAIYMFSAWFSTDLRALILPVIVLSFHTGGSIARIVQVNIAETRLSEHVRTAHAKGLTTGRILIWHIFRVSLLPTITVIGLQTGYLIGGAVITETLFLRPGIGRILLDATLRRDYPVVQAVVLLIAVTYAGINTLLDLLYSLLDPRIRYPAA